MNNLSMHLYYSGRTRTTTMHLILPNGAMQTVVSNNGQQCRALAAAALAAVTVTAAR